MEALGNPTHVVLLFDPETLEFRVRPAEFGGRHGWAGAINASGQIAENSSLPQRAFLWTPTNRMGLLAPRSISALCQAAPIARPSVSTVWARWWETQTRRAEFMPYSGSPLSTVQLKALTNGLGSNPITISNGSTVLVPPRMLLPSPSPCRSGHPSPSRPL